MAYIIALKINIIESDCIKTLMVSEYHSVSVIIIKLVFPDQFHQGMLVCDAFWLIAEKLPGTHLRNREIL
jgi:hypothetical protein